ncbi:protein-disulfide reductase DsbD domain-containing protein [Fimbriimonas ginsengisoli]|uniref:Thiol-disulfide interchange protein DsbD n=1 Tax=Fimbriimonas ginsengisoli Gsoil 348 TaxID=661478 RepID=A0A068NM90_FIMGI|nr:protein-disulfide reductase DsbD domain-containing protein [Fimbriimonas ginsengisoli]AIE84683.1 thiol-disulfide interchange protein DsbD [Fimbriimonas ginsengisoli Gsoil 348]
MIAILTAAMLGQTPPQSQASLVSSMRAVSPGQSFDVALRLSLKPGWHVYWRNPGESGIPPTLQWTLPAGWKASEIAWPVPHRTLEKGISNFIYQGDVLLPVRIFTSKATPPGSVTLKATAKWLVCRETCIPGKAQLSASVVVGGYPVADPDWASRLSALDEQIPRHVPELPLSASRRGNTISLSIAPKAAVSGVAFYPADDLIDPGAKQPLRQRDGKSELLLTIASYAPSNVERLKGLLVAPKGTTWAPGLEAITVDIPIQRKKP